MIKMSEGLLHLIIMVQDYKKYLQSKSMFDSYFNFKSINFYKETKDFYNNIDSEILALYGLTTNNISFEKVYNYEITEEVRSTEYCFLDKFDF
jgi:hypothetical protein